VDNVNDSKGHWSTQSFFGRINYNYKEKYLFEANLRYDGTSKFADEDRWVLAPSFSMGYNVAKEGFWKFKPINTLKVRASYGTIGNQNVSNYLYIPRLPVNTNLWWIQSGSRPVYTGMPDLVSKDLTWEKVTTSNIGLDFGAFSNKLTGSIDAFIRETIDMTGPSETYPSVMGISPPSANNADLETKGFEFVIKWNDKIGELGYSVAFTLANAMTKVTKYKNPEKLLSKYYEGREFGEIWGFETHGIFQTDKEAADWHDQTKISTHKWEAGDIGYKDLDGDGKITYGLSTVDDPGDRKIIGNSTPQFPYSITLAADWKGFDISMFFQGIGKRDLALGGNVMYGIGGGVWHSTALKEHLDFWSEDNKGAYLPRPLLGQGWKNQRTQTKYLQDASYLRLKNLTIGYSLPKSILDYANLRKVRVFVSGENLWTLTDLSESFDPEGTGSNSGVGKIYPLMSTMSFGININF
jgi:TonB-linked SusC/RagA family outer membrane protein